MKLVDGVKMEKVYRASDGFAFSGLKAVEKANERQEKINLEDRIERTVAEVYQGLLSYAANNSEFRCAGYNENEIVNIINTELSCNFGNMQEFLRAFTYTHFRFPGLSVIFDLIRKHVDMQQET